MSGQATRRPRLFVMLPAHLDTTDYHEQFLEGRRADRSPWGFGWAADHGYDVTFSRPTKMRGLAGFVQRVVRTLVGADLLHGWANRREIRESELVLTHMEREWVAAAFVIRGRRPTTPRLIANTIWLPGEWQTRSIGWRWAVNRARPKVEQFTFNALPAQAAFTAIFGDSTATRYVPFGISWESYLPATTGPASNSVLVAGDDRYRDWALLERVAGALPTVRFVVASRSTPASLGTLPNVDVVTASGPRDMQRLYEQSAVGFIPLKPNLHASGITVALETARIGRPIVISDTGGIGDYFSSSEVVFFAPGDAADAEAALSDLLDDPGRAQSLAESATERIAASANDSRSFIARLLSLDGRPT